ncbi:MAG: lysophospholipid acyltransferase family protein [Beutenbergiaceae bacterium]
MSSKPTDRYHWAWHRAVRRFCQRVILKGVVDFEVSVSVEGERNVDGLSGPFIVVANHSSHLDASTIVTQLPYRLTKNLAVAVAGDYFYNNFWRRTLTSFFFNSYPVDRGRAKSKNAGLSVSLLRQGVPLLIFPEGTRSKDGVMRSFKPGAAALARALRVPVVPVAIVGAYDAMPKGRNWPKPGRPPIKLLIGKPVRVRTGEALGELNDRIESRVGAMHSTQTATVLVRDDAPKPGQYNNAQEDAS